MAPAPQTDLAGRHVFTASRWGSLGTPGFQTVASSDSLSDCLPQLEAAVSGFHGAASDEPVASHRLAPGPGQRYLLTRFTPLAETFEGRTGNYRAETFAVPLSWLARLAFDPGAGIDLLPFDRPIEAATIAGPASLPETQLPAPRPRGLEELEALRRWLTPVRLTELLFALIRQCSVAGGIALAGRPGDAPTDVARMALQAPLLLPPALRLRARPHPAPLSIWAPLVARSPEPFDGLDLVALLDSVSLDQLDAGWTTVDLRGRSATRTHNEGEDYVNWLQQMIASRDWPQLLAGYRAAEGMAAADFFREFPRIRQSLPQPGIQA